MFEIQSNITREDYVQYNIDYVNHTKMGREQKYVHIVVGWLATAIACEVSYVEHLASKSIAIVTMLVMCFFIALFGMKSKKSLRVRVENQIRAAEKKGLFMYQPEATIVFDEEYVEEQAPEETIRVSYERVQEVMVFPYAIYVFESMQRAFLLPTRCFQGESERQELITFLQQKVKNLNFYD